jgi:hypothetical protein
MSRLNSKARLVYILLVVTVIGCESSKSKVDPAVLAGFRERFVSAEDPPQAISVDELRAELQNGGSNMKDSVVLVGQVGGIPNPLEQSQPNFPWQPGAATFYLVDREVASKLAAHMEAQGPDHGDCPFCARAIRKSAESMAVVSFHDNGKPIPIDARELFDLQEGNLIVLEGDATLIADEMLVVNARRIYVP